MLDLLDQYEACELPFVHFLALLPGLKPRYYSISSSPKVDEERVSITVAVVKGEAWSGRGEYAGVASNYLCDLQEGEEVACFLHEAQAGFQLPPSPEIPMIMIGPGTGIAPFRGFIQAKCGSMKENNLVKPTFTLAAVTLMKMICILRKCSWQSKRSCLYPQGLLSL